MGFQIPPEHFPLIEAEIFRSPKEIIERALALNVVINVGYGMPTDYARDWLASNKIDFLTENEIDLFRKIDEGAPYDENSVRIQVEALWVLVWALGFVKNLDFSSYCENSLSGLLPNLREFESSEKFSEQAVMKPYCEIYQALDLVYCISWALAEANLSGSESPGNLRQYVYWERRKALEWIKGGDWDAPDLST